MKYDVFISYRREGGYDTAKHLNDLLVRDGYKVSFDIDTLRNGDFDTQLLERIEHCKDFILIVDEHAFDRTLDPEFDPKKDWLRCELAHALKHNKNIIPVFLSGVSGFPDGLPADIVNVTKKNGPKYNRYYFNDFYKNLKKRFMISTVFRGKILYAISTILLICVTFWFITKDDANIPTYNKNTEQTDSTILTESIHSIDSTKYYWGAFDERSLYFKGLKRGVCFDANKTTNSTMYTYKCGLVSEISAGYVSQITEDIVFYATNEDGIREQLCTDFDNIGYNISSGYDGAYDIYRDNQYIIGQCDLDNDNTDELIISVRTSGDDMSIEGAGIGINVFTYDNNKWHRTAKLNTGTNVLPANVKIIKNSIYVYWLRYDEKYTYVNGSFMFDEEFYGRAFTHDDFNSKD